MPISNSKRFKSTISFWVKGVDKRLRFLEGLSFIGTTWYDKSFYNMPICWRVTTPIKNNLITYEDSDGIVYIGINMKTVQPICRVHMIWDSKVSLEEDMISWISNLINTGSRDSKFLNDHMKLLEAITDNWAFSFNDLTSNKSKIAGLPFYKKAIERVQDIADRAEFDQVLNDDKVFPKVQNRNMLPLLQMDFKKGQIRYYDSDIPKSPRSNVVVHNQVKFTENVTDMTSGLSVPRYWHDCYVTASPYISRIKIY